MSTKLAALNFRQRRALALKQREAVVEGFREERRIEAQYDAARKSAGRPRTRSELVRASKNLTAEQLYVLSMKVVLQARPRQIPRYQAAKELGQAIDDADISASLAHDDAPSPRDPTVITPKRHLTAIGMQAAEVLYQKGVIEDLKPPLGKHRNTDPLALTEVALESVEHLMDIAATPPKILHEPPTGQVIVPMPWTSGTMAPLPGAKVQQVTDLIRATKWRVNQAMLREVSKLKFQPWPTYRGMSKKKRAAKLEQLRKHLVAMPGNAAIERIELLERQAIYQAMKWLKHTFYFDGYYDWRGRYYSTGANGLDWTGGSDLVRSLLEFGEGFKLDKYGLAYLELHLTSMWGHGIDKLSDEERWHWVAANDVRIIGCGRREKLHRGFWRGAKEPFRFLAACIAAADALDGKPVHLPISFDVTCSGVGIYALLTRDAALAARVGILPDFRAVYGRRTARSWYAALPGRQTSMRTSGACAPRRDRAPKPRTTLRRRCTAPRSPRCARTAPRYGRRPPPTVRSGRRSARNPSGCSCGCVRRPPRSRSYVGRRQINSLSCTTTGSGTIASTESQ